MLLPGGQLIVDLLPRDFLETLSVDTREQNWHHMLKRSSYTNFVAESSNTIIGIASLGAARDEDLDRDKVGELYLIYLLKNYWGQGIGKALWLKALEDLKEKGYQEAMLWVLEDNTRAQRLYEAAGFKSDGAKKTESLGNTVLNEIRYRRKL